jgi:flagellar hook-associated protein 2
MVELNVLTRSDDSIVRELNYLSRDEQDALRKRLGVFAGDTALLRFKTALQDVIGAPYRGSNGDPILLNSFGISTDARRGGSYDPTKMRGYLEIDEKALDESLRTRLSQLREVFGLDTDGDKIIDTGLAYELDRAARPYVELGGIIAMRSGNLDSRITANERRIEGMDKKLDAKETQLRTQYGKIEGAYTRMERLSNSLEQFGKQGGGGGR